jgi:hypothetical protein
MNSQNNVVPLTPEMTRSAESTLVGIETLFEKTRKLQDALALCAVQSYLQQIGIIKDKDLVPKRVNRNGIRLEISEFPGLGCILVDELISASDYPILYPDDRYTCSDSEYDGYFIVYHYHEYFEILGFIPDFEDHVYFDDILSIEEFQESLSLV